MTTTTDLTTMTTEELREMAAAIAAELKRRAEEPTPETATPETPIAEAPKPEAPRRIVCRKKDLNGRGNGPMETRRVRLPSGTAGWASDLAQDVSGSWEPGCRLASERSCMERGYFPVGTIVVAYVSSLRGGSKTGPASVKAGVIVSAEEDAEHPIRWGLSTKGRGANVQVQTPAGEWVSV